MSPAGRDSLTDRDDDSVGRTGDRPVASRDVILGDASLDVLSRILMAAPVGIPKESRGGRRSHPERAWDPGLSDHRAGVSGIAADHDAGPEGLTPGRCLAGGPCPPDRLPLAKEQT